MKTAKIRTQPIICDFINFTPRPLNQELRERSIDFLRESVDSFYELIGDLPDLHFAKSTHVEDSSDNFALPSKIFTL